MATRVESDSVPKAGKRKESSSFLKKRTKKLLFDSGTCRTYRPRQPNEQKFFFFFSKKKFFLPSPVCQV